MTLVVAKKFKGRVAVVGDTGLSANSILRPHPFWGTVKTLVLKPSLSVSYSSSDVHAAWNLIAEASRYKDTGSVIRCLAAGHRTGRHTDFIVTHRPLYEEGILSDDLYLMLNGEVSKVESAWIGDLAGFESFQAHYLPAVETEENSKLTSGPHGYTHARNLMVEALEGAIANRAGSLRGFAVALNSNPNGYEYSSRSYNTPGFAPPIRLQANQWHTLDLGSASTGASHTAILASNLPDIPAVAIYLPLIKTLLAFVASKSFIMYGVRCEDHKDINPMMEEYFGVRLDGALYNRGRIWTV